MRIEATFTRHISPLHYQYIQSQQDAQPRKRPHRNRHTSHNTTQTPFLLLLLIRKPQTNTINAVPLILRAPEPLPLKHMPQVAPAVRARNLRPHHPERAVLEAPHGAGEGLEVGGPPAVRVELLRGGVQGRGAAGAGVGAGGGVVLVVGAGAWGFGPLLAEDAELFCVV